jgi:hypothetical protein
LFAAAGEDGVLIRKAHAIVKPLRLPNSRSVLE